MVDLNVLLKIPTKVIAYLLIPLSKEIEVSKIGCGWDVRSNDMINFISWAPGNPALKFYATPWISLPIGLVAPRSFRTRLSFCSNIRTTAVRDYDQRNRIYSAYHILIPELDSSSFGVDHANQCPLGDFSRTQIRMQRT
jgi:hypothetical protein